MYSRDKSIKAENDKKPFSAIIDVVILIGILTDRIIQYIPDDIFRYWE